MPETGATRSAALALAEERTLMRQGHRFLDEKRVLLAAELLRRLREHEAMVEQVRRQTRDARAALRSALRRHGLDGLQVYPAAAPRAAPQATADGRFLGVTLIDVTVTSSAPRPDTAPVDPSPEAQGCMQAFAALLDLAGGLAASSGNLERLANEYRRTERRARALENVLLPEVERALASVQEQLDLADLEEVARTRLAGGRSRGTGDR